MTTDHSAVTPKSEYIPTIIDNHSLINRLAIQLTFVGRELKQAWREFKGNPIAFGAWVITNVLRHTRELLSTPHLLPAATTAFTTIICAIAIVLMLNSAAPSSAEKLAEMNESSPELVLLELPAPPEVPADSGFGGSRAATLRASGMGGGNHDPLPPQAGKYPPPSVIPAAIPITPPLNAPTLPLAGINIDPALWKDIEAPVFGDPNSKSQVPSSGPGSGGGIGTGEGPQIGGSRGCGIGPGEGFGFGPGGCATGRYESRGKAFRVSEVEQRPRILSKPEPQYTEEARKNLLSGTVMLRVIFSSSGEVVQIQAIHTLPFGLTERAIAAARQIKFVPATKGGQPVSVAMQLEYNFNLY